MCIYIYICMYIHVRIVYMYIVYVYVYTYMSSPLPRAAPDRGRAGLERVATYLIM